MMSEIIFAIPVVIRDGYYDSYRDLVQLIRLSEYKACWYDEVDPQSDNCYIHIVSNGEIQNGYEAPKARMILWDFEHRPETYPFLNGFAEHWHMDAAQARQHGVRYMPLGGDKRLCSDAPVNDTFDYHVAYMAYMTHRRQRILDELRQANLRIAGNAWGMERHSNLTHSRVYLHVHQLDNAPAVPALRMVVAAAYGLPVITEVCANDGIFTGYMVESDHGRIVQTVRAAVQDPSIEEIGWALAHLLNEEYTFAKGIEAAV